MNAALEFCPRCLHADWPQFAWVVCFKTEPDGYFRHEAFCFGPGSPATDSQSESWARTWDATHRLPSWPRSTLRAIFRRPENERSTVGPRR